MRKILLSLLVSSSALPSAEAAQPLKLGEAAPYAGQLVTSRLATLLSQKAEACDERSKLNIDYVKHYSEIDLSLERQLRIIDKDMAAQTQKSLETALAEARRPPPIVERPWFVATVTATITLVLAAATLAVAVRVIEVRNQPANP